MHIRPSRAALAGLLLALLPAETRAQVSEGKAISMAKAGLKAALKQEKAELKLAEAQLDASIDQLGLAAETGPLVAADLEDVLPGLLQGMHALSAAVGTARAAACVAAEEALAALGGTADLDGQFPATFDFGGNGLADDVTADTRALADKTLAAVRKHAAKAAKSAAKAGRGLTFALPGPDFTFDGPTVFSEDTTLAAGPGASCVLFVIGTSDLSVPADGLLLIGGQLTGSGVIAAGAAVSLPPASAVVRLDTPFDGEVFTVNATFGDIRDPALHFGGVIDGEGVGLLEGGAILTLLSSAIALQAGAAPGQLAPPPSVVTDVLAVSVP